ncbi:cell division protein ZapE [Temperatibacter marinus]|uniref:Cell division protein ZapE n=1 Tax=Temperatibacter marinus TaxID=1456591 RepID=A0AA52H9F3_9PROT|nr:cell division protein ZapE [Temperatibacter marinus]WND01625.1 cell division protein ZapE [Temperatibacter marinus]
MADENLLGPLETYHEMARIGEITIDQDQLRVVEHLERLFSELKDYPEVAGRSKGLAMRSWRMMKMFSWGNRKLIAPKGLYLHGGVGRGKSMLMDLFYDCAPVRFKRRVHFHDFMLDVHARLKVWNDMSTKERAAMGSRATGDDPIPPVARQLAQEATLLCFDEMQVTDIADAMVLARLFGELLDRGVVVISTSNRVPDDLYKDGINRQLFLPFIERIKKDFDVVPLDGPTDYRLGRMKGLQTYYSPLNEESTDALRAAFFKLTDRNVEDADQVPTDMVEVQGRKVFVPKAARGVAVFSFKRLCAAALGAADYLAIARRYHTIIMVAIPKLGPHNRNEAKRFVTFIDALYENGVKFLCSSEAEAVDLYKEGDGAFEFERTVSRLMEMQSEDYLKRGHGALE